MPEIHVSLDKEVTILDIWTQKSPFSK